MPDRHVLTSGVREANVSLLIATGSGRLGTTVASVMVAQDSATLTPTTWQPRNL